MIIFLNGSINAGKSTVAKTLAKQTPQETADYILSKIHELQS